MTLMGTQLSLCAYFIFPLLIIAYWWHLRSHKLYKTPPMFPGGLPIIHHSLTILIYGRNIWEFLKNVMLHTSNNGQDICTLKWGQYTTHVLTNPDDCYTISNVCLEKHYGYKFAKVFLGEGLLTGTVSVWKHHRKLLNPALNQQVLDGFLSVFNRESRNLTNVFKDKAGKSAFDHFAHIKNWALIAVCSTTMGLHLDEDSSHILNEYMTGLHELFDCIMERVPKIWLHNDYLFKFSNLKKRQDALLEKLNKLSNKILKDKETDMLNKMNDVLLNSRSKFKSYLELLLELKHKNIFTDQDVIEEANTIIATGYDTTSVSMTLILTVLGTFPEVQDKIYSELQEIFGGVDRDVTKEDLSQMKYLEAAIKESLRVYPSAPVVLRNIDKDIRIRDYTLKAGDDYVIALYALNRHSVWGPDAEVFRPERWLNPSSLPEKSYAFASFSIGRRGCIGMNYAMMNMKTMLAHILRYYKITADINKVKYELLINLNPVSGHHIKIEHRQKV